MKLFPQLPPQIKVKIFQGKSGVWIAELPEYDIFTEADSPLELDFQINDLIYAHFDIPKKSQKFIRYVPKKSARKPDVKNLLMFKQFIAPEAASSFNP